MVSLTFYNAWFCPYAQRAWIALSLKGIGFELVEQDPYKKSEEWLKINPRGLVPAVVHKGKAIYESALLIQYLDDCFPEKPILPSDPYEKFQARLWGDFLDKKLIPLLYKILRASKAEQWDFENELMERIKEFCTAMNANGPFFFGAKFGYVDILFAPFALRIEWLLSHFTKFKVPSDGVYERYHKWFAAVQKESSFVLTLAEKEKLIGLYADKYPATTSTS